MSLKSKKKPRKLQTRPTPYPPPTNPTPSPSSEPEIVPLSESVAFFDTQNLVCASPAELSKLREDTPPEKPLGYGDLVVVDYAEKKKVYKWPAIVHRLW